MESRQSLKILPAGCAEAKIRVDMIVQCKICGDDFKARPSTIKIRKNVFCSRTCWIKHKTTKLEKECVICKNKFFVSKSRNAIGYGNYCSAKCYGVWQSHNRLAENNSCWRGGKVKSVCCICKKDLIYFPSLKKKFCSYKCAGKWKSENLIREKNHRWLNGKSFEKYSMDWTITLKQSIRERDSYTCQICKKPQGVRRHSVHHIDYDKKNCNPNNLTTLCVRCHTGTNHNRKHWIKYFKDSP